MIVIPFETQTNEVAKSIAERLRDRTGGIDDEEVQKGSALSGIRNVSNFSKSVRNRIREND